MIKANKVKKPFDDAMQKHAAVVNDPRTPFNVKLLSQQLVHECVQDYGDPKWKAIDERSIGYCASLLTRVNGVLSSPNLRCVFGDEECPDITDTISHFITGDDRLLRICLGAVSYEYNARELVANALGRHLLTRARAGDFRSCPIVVFVDEAHNFLGRRFGTEHYTTPLDAFELIAKEGRKYGLNLCLASQRPRDITEGVLSQMGTLIVHRLTNDRDREVVERACGEIDRSASSFLPNLHPGEAAIIGTDFPIPLTLQVAEPGTKPHSDGPNYQKYSRKDS